ncbi:MAG TPA: plasma-membrane proton-efflux P-type ATPase [Oscillatoriaceae cyanobacterium]
MTPRTPIEAGTRDLGKIPLEQLEHDLGYRPEGLGAEEAVRRLAEYGPNALPEKHAHPLLKFLSYFWGPIPRMIEAAALLSWLVRHWADMVIILALLVLNAAVGFWEEFQAGNAVAALKRELALNARVRRDGAWRLVPAGELVPGDRVRLRIGDVVPADARLVEAGPLTLDQSALTGESLPVSRGMGEVAYSGAVVKQGEADALVYATGEASFFGRATHLVATTRNVSHLQRTVLTIGNYLIVSAVALVVVILAVGLWRGDDRVMLLEFALVLTVAAIPVAMPTVLSVSMAVGARNLARKQAIVTRLTAIEELAGLDVLCTDKTGTLTQNRLTLGTPFSSAGSREDLLRAAAFASRAEDQDPIDLAVLQNSPPLPPGAQVIEFVPFDPVRKRTEAEVELADGARFRVTKGAPQVVLALCAPAESVRGSADAAIDDFARRGYRSLGVARRDEGAWQFLGVLPLFDPPREDARQTLAEARRMGLDVKMVTGDQVPIAREIAAKLDLGTRILDADDLERLSREPRELDSAVAAADGFAQVFPEHKYRIVAALQKAGHLVGMTGDGVNDAPALKKADAGVAVAGATDAARAAAAIVLLAPGLSVLIDAIVESRRIFQRMQSYAQYRIVETVRVLLLMTLSILAFNFYPVTAVMIVLLAILNDGAILTIAYDRVAPSPQPERWKIGRLLAIATLIGLTGVIASFGLFYLAEVVFRLPRDTIQTLMYLKLSVAGHLTIFVTRTRGAFWSSRPAPVLAGAVLATQAIATVIAVYGLLMTPIGWQWALFVWAYALVWMFVNDRVKLLAHRLLDDGWAPWRHRLRR